jgi:hypothetical protein
VYENAIIRFQSQGPHVLSHNEFRHAFGRLVAQSARRDAAALCPDRLQALSLAHARSTMGPGIAADGLE